MAATSAQLLTVEQWMDLPEEQTRRTELVDGEIVQMGNARAIHEKLKSAWAKRLYIYFADKNWGAVYSETMYRLSPGLARISDVSVLLPDRPAPEGAFEGAPEIAIEIVSSETAAEMGA